MPESPATIIQEQSDWQEFFITNFLGGICTSLPASNIKDNQFVSLVNFYIEDDGSLKTRGPYQPYLVSSYDTQLAHPPLRIGMYDLTGHTRLLAACAAEDNVYIVFWDSSVPAWVKLKSANGDLALASSGRVEMLAYSTNGLTDLIICNGQDAPKRWKGGAADQVTDLGLAVPTLGALSSSEAGAANKRGLTVTGNYYYQFTAFYDNITDTRYGESGPSAATAAIAGTGTTATPKQLTLTGCPEIPSGASRINVYRSPADTPEGPFRYVGFYTQGTQFVDTCPNGEEGEEPPLDDGKPPKRLKYITMYQGRIFGVDGDLPYKVVYTPQGQPDLFPATNYFYMSEPVTGLGTFNRNLYIFTASAIYVLLNGDVSVDPLKVAGKGCVSHYSIVDVGNGLCWVSADNVYWADFNTQAEDGDFPIPIGEPIKDKIRDISPAHYTNTVSCLYRDRYYLCYTSTGIANSATLVWHPKYGGWTMLSWMANDLCVYNGTLYTADGTNKYIQEHDVLYASGIKDYKTYAAYTAGTGHPIGTSLLTKVYHLGHECAKKIIGSMSVVAETSGVSVVAQLLMISPGGTIAKTQNILFGTSAATKSANPLIWGQGLWNAAGGAEWAEVNYQLEKAHKRISRGAKGTAVQLMLFCPDTQHTNIINLKLYYKTLPRPA